VTTYEHLGLGDLVERCTNRKQRRDDLCHHDPMFVDGECFFGQCDAAQSHLRNQGVGNGDVFLFFGLFADEFTGEPHHRFFGYMRVEQVHTISSAPLPFLEKLQLLRHPHVLGIKSANNTVYWGEGALAKRAWHSLRLTKPRSSSSHWIVPSWLRTFGLTYHPNPGCWVGDEELISARRGQEFVCDIGNDPRARAWMDYIIAEIRG